MIDHCSSTSKVASRLSLTLPARGSLSVVCGLLILNVLEMLLAGAPAEARTMARSRRSGMVLGPATEFGGYCTSHSHSMVAGGLLLTSRTTRLIPRTSLVI